MIRNLKLVFNSYKLNLSGKYCPISLKSYFYTNTTSLLSKYFSTMAQQQQIKAPVDLVQKYRRKQVEDLLKRKFYYIQAFEIYNGQGGLYDYGPPGCALKNNVEQLWRQHFILQEDLLELSATCLTPQSVLVASVKMIQIQLILRDTCKNSVIICLKIQRMEIVSELINIYNKQNSIDQQFFVQWLNKAKTSKKSKIPKQECDQILSKLEGFNADDIRGCVDKYGIKSAQNNDLIGPIPFNLMFQTQLGPTGKEIAYLRPETAQGIFMNFKRMLQFNNNRLPFGGAQIGLSFRNQISPRSALLRTRQFEQAEIEFFYQPGVTKFPKFKGVKDVKLPLLQADGQANKPNILTDITIGQAVEKKIVKNQILAYFMVRCYEFLKLCGIREEGIRFRQHVCTEMAHYAQDCWDAQIETSYGWIEVAGNADRACFDLTMHAKATKKNMNASKPLPEPIVKEVTQVVVDKKKLKSLGKVLKKSLKVLEDQLNQMLETQEKQKILLETLQKDGKMTFEIEVDNGKEKKIEKVQVLKDWISVRVENRTITQEKFIPHVIQPSFGVARILYCIFEHCFHVRKEDEQRTYFTFPPAIAPVKMSILPLTQHEELMSRVGQLKKLLNLSGISNRVDDSSQTMGKRYSRTDELGIPYSLCIDFQTLKDNTVTFRDIHTTKQIRILIDQLIPNTMKLLNNQLKWEDLLHDKGEFIFDKNIQGVGAIEKSE